MAVQWGILQPVQSQGFDPANTLMQVAQLKQMEQRNRLIDLQEKEANQKIEDRNKLRTALPKAMQGDQDAVAEVQTINPELWNKIDTAKREKIKGDTETVGRLLYSVEQEDSVRRPILYKQALDIARQQGVDVSTAPPDYNPAWTKSMLARAISLSDQIKQAEGSVRGVGNQVVRVRGNNVDVLHTAPDKEDHQLVEVADESSPTGTRFVRRSDAVGQPGKPPSGMTLTSDGKGGFTLVQGRAGGKPDSAGMAQPTVNAVEEQILNNTGRLQRLMTVAGQFKPEYLTFKGQVTNWGAAMAEKAGVNLDPQSKTQLAEYTKFRADAFNDLSQTLKEMSGAAVTPQEYERLVKSLGDPSGDSPTEFKAKLDRTVRDVRLAQARLSYIRANGLKLDNFGGIGLADMPKIIDQRGAQLEQEMKAQNPQLSPDDLRNRTLRALAQEFGTTI
jgi:hypothetical protein